MLVYNTTKAYQRFNTFHTTFPRGMAYETVECFIHYFGNDDGLWDISPYTRVVQRKNGDLRDWVVQSFGAVDIEEATNNPAETITGVWRPGLDNTKDILACLGETEATLSNGARAQTLLLKYLSEIFDYVEPSASGLQAYGHKPRELIILACTEVENAWISYLRNLRPRGHRFTTNDYVQLKAPLHLNEYKINLDKFALPAIRPFANWDVGRPTQSLPWYHVYNQVKHDRIGHFPLATVENSINAVAASLTMFAVRFGPYYLSQSGSVLSGLFNEMFSIELDNPDPKTFYIPDFPLELADNDGYQDHGELSPSLNNNRLPFRV